MNTYSDTNPPKSGTAKKIYASMKKRGMKVRDLHYNPNNWGQNRDRGWGTWACEVVADGERFEGFCGLNNGRIYLEMNRAPYKHYILEVL